MEGETRGLVGILDMSESLRMTGILGGRVSDPEETEEEREKVDPYLREKRYREGNRVKRLDL